MKKTYQAFPVKKLPEELRRGLGADGVVEITIEAPEVAAPQPEADPVDLAAPGALAGQGKRVEELCARRKFW
ncbi:MAG: hypothetical protein QNJ06_20625 [Kiloniellales bacterium]|nr:hypothetical protein [Kiloniellales bacterium]MDJ0983799.1 hypothetical protein [Kiloniellales bacterium]